MEACKKEGINPKDLIKLSKGEILQKYKEYGASDNFEDFSIYLEKKRNKLLNHLKKVRLEIIHENNNNSRPFSATALSLVLLFIFKLFYFEFNYKY